MFEYYCKVTRVVDGDTVDVDIDLGFDIHHRARVRMLGIDTPESRTRNLAEKALGLASKVRVKEILKRQTTKLATTKEGRGKFGRILATVYVIDKEGNEVDCNARLCEVCHCSLPGWSPDDTPGHVHARPYYGGKKVPWVNEG